MKHKHIRNYVMLFLAGMVCASISTIHGQTYLEQLVQEPTLVCSARVMEISKVSKDDSGLHIVRFELLDCISVSQNRRIGDKIYVAMDTDPSSKARILFGIGVYIKVGSDYLLFLDETKLDSLCMLAGSTSRTPGCSALEIFGKPQNTQTNVATNYNFEVSVERDKITLLTAQLSPQGFKKHSGQAKILTDYLQMRDGESLEYFRKFVADCRVNGDGAKIETDGGSPPVDPEPPTPKP